MKALHLYCPISQPNLDGRDAGVSCRRGRPDVAPIAAGLVAAKWTSENRRALGAETMRQIRALILRMAEEIPRWAACGSAVR
jgi:hypothetical protein